MLLLLLLLLLLLPLSLSLSLSLLLTITELRTQGFRVLLLRLIAALGMYSRVSQTSRYRACAFAILARRSSLDCMLP